MLRSSPHSVLVLASLLLTQQAAWAAGAEGDLQAPSAGNSAPESAREKAAEQGAEPTAPLASPASRGEPVWLDQRSRCAMDFEIGNRLAALGQHAAAANAFEQCRVSQCGELRAACEQAQISAHVTAVHQRAEQGSLPQSSRNLNGSPAGAGVSRTVAASPSLAAVPSTPSEPLAAMKPEMADTQATASSASLPIASYVLGGAALVGFGTFGALQWSAHAARQEFEQCAPNCKSGALDVVDQRERSSLVALGIGAAAAAGAVGFWLFGADGGSSSDETLSSSVFVEPTSGGAVGRWVGHF